MDVFLETEVAFEASIYHMHIQAKKLETEPGSIFARYRVLETERELIRFGLGEFIPSLITLPDQRCSHPRNLSSRIILSQKSDPAITTNKLPEENKH